MCSKRKRSSTKPLLFLETEGGLERKRQHVRQDPHSRLPCRVLRRMACFVPLAAVQAVARDLEGEICTIVHDQHHAPGRCPMQKPIALPLFVYMIKKRIMITSPLKSGILPAVVQLIAVFCCWMWLLFLSIQLNVLDDCCEFVASMLTSQKHGEPRNDRSLGLFWPLIG